MGDGNVWALAGSAFLLLDFSNYGIKEWLQLIVAAIAIVVAIIGAWKHADTQSVRSRRGCWSIWRTRRT